ncbi:GDP-mannose 4,6-dehydratase [Allomesorhizobium camelthorni]|uniref:NAD-dependent epimerase/dehydratase family protein n=1 Tax=Allomesorhizobium camelthorni TaxID=475069 RepID=A0A6G4WFK6_9HYPH|nr:GDP-mannose 4,6-dehydratase [Mesorhizobium camelthorni]NGO52910.1 NAD-dependent epimerase/dehydratase family protein [Mesorhizobium camelthorni]
MTDPAFWRGKRVLVAGATGFLGGWLVRRLVEYEAQVVSLVHRPKPESQFYLGGFDRKTEVVQGDISDAKLMSETFDRYSPEVFFHAAGWADVIQVLKDPLQCFRGAVLSTWTILEHIRANEVGCVSVISSSDKAYGSQALPYRESAPLTPVHPYEVAKASQDYVAQSYGKIYGLPVAVTRCGNYFGGYDFNFARLIPGVIRSLVEGEQPILRSDGKFTRDYLYIEDAVDVQLDLAEKLHRDPTLYGEAFNFSYGAQVEVIEIVERIAELFGSAVKPLVNNSVSVEIRHMHLSSDKARSRLGWEPACGFDEGLKRTVDWYIRHIGGKTEPSQNALSTV